MVLYGSIMGKFCHNILKIKDIMKLWDYGLVFVRFRFGGCISIYYFFLFFFNI